jgi:outer membrane protein OmpA-like peptidoglycan-associated protein
MKKLLVLSILILSSFAASAQKDLPASYTDYPLISSPQNYEIISYRTEPYSVASFVNPRDEKPVVKNGKKILIKYKLRKGMAGLKNPQIFQKRGSTETVWYQLKTDSLNYYYLINKPSAEGVYEEESFPILNTWIHQEISPDGNAYSLTILEEAVQQTGQIKKKMDTLRVKGRVELYTIYFDTNKYQYEKESELTINEIVNFLKKEDEIRVQIVGSADSTGSTMHNQALSEKRAGYIREKLVEKGVAAERLSAKGIGETTAISDPDRDKALQLNRRTVLIKEN